MYRRLELFTSENKEMRMALTRMAFSRPYPPTPLRLFVQISGAKRKPSGTTIYHYRNVLSYVLRYATI